MLELEFEKPDSCPNNATCVEVAFIPPGESVLMPAGSVLVNKPPKVEWLDEDTVRVSAGGVALVYDRAEWLAFLASCQGTQYEL